MNPCMATQGAPHCKRIKPHRRPIGAPVERFHQPVFVCQRDNLQIHGSRGDGLQNPVSKIGLDGEQFCVRLFETEFGEVA